MGNKGRSSHTIRGGKSQGNQASILFLRLSSPEYSQLYLNEFCFFRNLKVFGLDAIVQNWRERIGVEVEEIPTAIEDKNRPAELSKWRRDAKPASQAPFALPKLKAIVPTQVRIVNKKCLSISPIQSIQIKKSRCSKRERSSG